MLQASRRGHLGLHTLVWVVSAALAVGLSAGRLAGADDKPANDKPGEPEQKPLVELKLEGQQSKPDADKPARERTGDDPAELVKPLGPTTHPATRPATNPAAKADKKDEKKLDVPTDVRTVLDKVRDAYKDMKTLKLAGEITGEFDMNGEQQTHRAEFTALFQSPTTFRHQLREEVPVIKGKPTLSEPMLVGGTGKKIYLWEPRYKY